MFNIFRKQPDKAPAEVKKPPMSIFSTDLDMDYESTDYMERKLSMSIQRTIEDFKPVKPDGTTGDFAMDEAYPNLQLAKFQNAGGYGMPGIQFGWFASQGFIGWQSAAIISQNWLVDKACSMPAKDASRHGYEITVNDGQEIDPKILEYITQKDKHFKINKQCVDLVRYGRIFGIRVAMFIVESPDPAYYEKTFNPDGVTPGSYKGISQIDPYWITPELSMTSAANPAAPDFYEPTWWRINGQRVHRTHLVIFKNGEVPDILKPSYYYGGIPVPQKIAERVFAAERIANEAPQLAMSKRLISVFTDLTQAQANQQAFTTRMTWWTSMMNNFGVKILGLGDKLEQHDISLSDLDEVIMTQFKLVAAASNVPETKLLGTSPKGFNATGEYEESSYHEELESIQEHDLTPLVERHHLLLILSDVSPKFGVMFKTSVNWNPVDSPTAEELADINAKKADTDGKLVQAGAIDGFDVRQRIIADKDSGYNGIPSIVPDGPGDREAQQEAKEALEQPVTAKETSKGESGNDSASFSLDGDDQWITINGAHVKIDASGNVTEGPKHLKEELHTVEKSNGKPGGNARFLTEAEIKSSGAENLARAQGKSESHKGNNSISVHSSTSKLPFVQDLIKEHPQREKLMSHLSKAPTEKLEKALAFTKGHSDEDTKYIREAINEELKDRKGAAK